MQRGDRNVQSNRAPRAAAGIAMATVLAFSSWQPVRATTFIPVGVEDLARGAEVVFIGTVGSVTATQNDDGRIVTLIEVRVDELISGSLEEDTLTLQEPGGRVGELREVVFGAPSYARGEEVVVFAERRRDGTWRTLHLALGTFHVERDAGGGTLATQELGHGARVLIPPQGTAWRDRMPLAELVQRVRAATAAETQQEAPAPLTAGDDTFVAPAWTAPGFTLQGPARHFEVDEGEEISYLIDDRGDAILGFEDSHQGVLDGLAAWNAVSTSRIVLTERGLTSDLEAPCEPGLHKVRFNDPGDEISEPMRAPGDSSNCGGTLAIGGFCSTSSEQKGIDGTIFDRVLRADVFFADDWDGCSAWTPCNFAEVAAHELGHSIGLGHSSEDREEPDFLLADATMYFLSHFDGRCATTGTDDVNGVTFIYPIAMPVTITTESELDVFTGVLNNIPLTAVGGTGSFQWEEVDIGCPDVGLTVTPDGVISGTPNAIGSTCLAARATDDNGDFHLKRFEIALSTASTPTPTVPATPTFTPVADCIGDCNEDDVVSVAELVFTLNMALGLTPFVDCHGVDANGNQEIGIDEVVRAVLSAVARCE